jgi:hypothetical protein
MDADEIAEEESVTSSKSMSKNPKSHRDDSHSRGSDVSMSDHKYKAKLKNEEEEEDDKIFGINPNKISSSMAAITRSLKKSADQVQKEVDELEHCLETQNKMIKKAVRDLTFQYLESVKNAQNNFDREDLQ